MEKELDYLRKRCLVYLKKNKINKASDLSVEHCLGIVDDVKTNLNSCYVMRLHLKDRTEVYLADFIKRTALKVINHPTIRKRLGESNVKKVTDVIENQMVEKLIELFEIVEDTLIPIFDINNDGKVDADDGRTVVANSCGAVDNMFHKFCCCCIKKV